MQELYDGRYLGAIREWLEINDFAVQVTVQHVYFARLRELYSAVGAQHLRFADMRELYNESRQHGDTATTTLPHRRCILMHAKRPSRERRPCRRTLREGRFVWVGRAALQRGNVESSQRTLKVRDFNAAL